MYISKERENKISLKSSRSSFEKEVKEKCIELKRKAKQVV